MSHQFAFRYTVPMMEPHRIREAVSQLLDVKLIEQVASKFTASLPQEALRAFNGRLERGLELAKNGAVQPMPDAGHPRRFFVRSSDGTHYYEVDLDSRTCNCPDSLKGNSCKHRIAAYYFDQAQKLEQQAKQAQQSPSPRPAVPIKPTCSVQPTPDSRFKPTCSIPPTKAEFELAEKRAAKPPETKPAVPPTPKRTEKEILAEMGFDSESPKVTGEAHGNGVQLGTLYRRYLHGSDLGQQALKVTIQDITKERVCPHPSQPVEDKWCLWVYGLPDGLPNGILFGSRGEDDLIAIFGKVSLEELKGKMIVIYAKPTSVGGQTKMSLRFRRMLQ
jgi:hypothetical protein